MDTRAHTSEQSSSISVSVTALPRPATKRGAGRFPARSQGPPLQPAQACVCACMLNTCTIYATAHKDPPDVLVAAACVPIVVDDGHREHAHLIPTFSQAQFAVSVHIKNPPFQHPLSHAKLCMKVVWFH